MSIKKSISFTLGAQVINTIFAFISSIIITRILGAAGRGEFAIFTNALAFTVLFFGFSISSTIPYFINSGKAKIEELFTTIIIFSVISTCIVFGFLYLLEYFNKLHWVLPDKIKSLEYKLIFTFLYLNTLLSGVISTCLLAFKKFKEVSLYNIFLQALPLTLYLLVYLNIIPADPLNPFKTIVFITALISLLSIITIIILFFHILPVQPARRLIPFSMVKQFILFSSMAYAGNIFQFFSYRLDLWFVDEYHGKIILGIYSLAVQLSQLLWILPQSLANVLYSYASSYDESHALKITLHVKRIAFYGSLAFGIVGLILSYIFIPLLYGKEFVPAISLIFILLIGIIPFSIPMIMASFFAARGNFKYSFYIATCVSIVTFLVYFLVIPRYGAKGAACATVFSYLTSTIIVEYVIYKKYRINPFSSLKLDKGIWIEMRKILTKQELKIS